MAQRERGAAAPRPAGGGTAGTAPAVLRERLRTLVEPVVSDTGLYLEELTVTRMGRRNLVRITVDGEDGIGHDELSEASHRLSTALDEVEETQGDLLGPYTLEVSSPGIDRPLTLPRHWRGNVGRLVAVRVGDRTLTQRVTDVTADGVVFEGPVGDGDGAPVPFEKLGPGRVQVEFTRLAELSDDELGAEYDDGDEVEDGA